MASQPIYISIEGPFGGFAPAFWENSYPSYGNRNQARDMTNIDLADPTGFKQGPGLSNLTNGTEAAAVTTLLKHILSQAISADVAYGIGGAKLYKISSTAVTSDATWPRTIDKAVVTGEDGESVVHASGALYYFYNHSGSAGDIGKYNLASTFDDDWGSTVPTGAAALANAPHPAIFGNDGVIYFGNGPAVGTYDPLTNVLSTTELDLPTGSQVVDVRYLNSRIWAFVNFPNVSGSNGNIGIIYVWDGVSGSWDDFPNPRIQGRIGAGYVKDGVMFIWYEEVGFTGGYKLGYVRGNQIIQVASFTGSLPNFGQVSEQNGMLIWISNGEIWRWGASSKDVPVALSQYADAGYTTAGALSSPFGTVMVASTQSSSYKLAKLSGLDVASSWKSLMFKTGPAMIDKVRVHFSNPGSGVRADVKITRDQGIETITLERAGQTGSITNTDDSGYTIKDFDQGYEVQSELSVEVDFSNGSTSNAITIMKIEIYAHTLEKD